ncbi:helix-turn-helix domain-containing protein [Thalassobaculum litoreum]
MREAQAIEALLGMAHQHRMRVFKLLMKRGPSGLPAGEIGDRVGISRSSASFHLTQMERAGLLRSRRVHRNVFYAVDLEGMRKLIAYLTEDCCDGHPEVCGSLVTGMPIPACGEGVE